MGVFKYDLGELCSPSPIADDPAYQEATRFKKEIEPEEGVDYDWAWDYAESNFNRLYAIGKELDDKANNLIKYLGGGTGLFTLTVLVNVRPENLPVLRWAVPAFLCALASIFFAVLARDPSETRIPATAKAAFRYANQFRCGQKAKGAFLGLWHQASEGMVVANLQKARQVRLATWAFFLTIALLVLPVLVTLFG